MLDLKLEGFKPLLLDSTYYTNSLMIEAFKFNSEDVFV